MPRAARIVDPNGCYHITCRGNNRASVFHDSDDLIAYLHILKQCKRLCPFELFHYCLMPNHVHLLLRLVAGMPIAVIMKTISQRYSLYYKRRYGHIGHLWQDRFFSRLVDADEYLLTCGAYIELNPVRAGLVSRVTEYRWSSVGHYLLGRRNDLVDADPLFASLGTDDLERRSAYLRILSSQRGEKIG